MKRPEFRTRVMGHPLIVAPMAAATLGSVYVWSQHPEGWWLAAICIATMGAVTKAHEIMRTYKAWKRAWDAMNPEPPRAGPTVRHLLGMVAVAFMALLLANQPGAGAMIGWSLGGVAGLLVVLWLARRVLGLRRRMRTVKLPAVRIVARRGVFPAMSLGDAYRALPDYCQRLVRP